VIGYKVALSQAGEVDFFSTLNIPDITPNMKSSISLFIATLASLVSGIDGLKVRDTKCGCGTPLPNGIKPDESVNLTLDSNSGVSPRKYRLHLPQGYDNSKKLPLILSFHGRTQDALYQEELSQFSNASYGFEGISVYPQGVPLINKVRYLIQMYMNKPC
jgi:poly(3-hydroxybutyrate) depolymerase